MWQIIIIVKIYIVLESAQNYSNMYIYIPGGSVVKNLPANAEDLGDTSSISGSGRSPGVGNGNPLQYSCQKNSIDRETWLATVHGVTKNWTD